MKKLLLIINFCLISTFLIACSKKDEPKKTNIVVEKEDTEESLAKEEAKNENIEEIFDADDILTIGIEKDIPSLNFNKNNELVGFNIELGEKLAKKLDLNVEFKIIDASKRNFELNSNNIDLVLDSFYSPENALDFSEPFLEDALIFTTLKNNVDKIKNFKDIVLGVKANSFSDYSVLNNKDFLESLKDLKIYDTYDKLKKALDNKEINAILIDSVIADGINKTDTNKLIKIGDNFTIKQVLISFSKENKLLRKKVQLALDNMLEDGTLKNLSLKWFDKDISIYNK